MSLIEQAARRLEELRRAGVELPEPHAEPPQMSRANGESPTPEALIEALEARAGEPSPLLKDRRRDEVPAAHPAAPGVPGRHVDLNLGRLKSLGFVTPDMPTSRMADEFRVVKRPIIHNALGLGEEKVRHGNLVMVTSAVPGEGKTFTSINLAMSVAMEYDSRVLLVDGDVAHPSFPTMLGTPHSPGLLDLLTRDDLEFLLS